MPYLILIKFKYVISRVARMGKTGNAYRIFVGLHRKKKPFRTNKHRWEEETTTYEAMG